MPNKEHNNNVTSQCREIIEISQQVKEIYRTLDEVNEDKRIQDVAIRHTDHIINDIRSQQQEIIGLVKEKVNTVITNLNMVIEDIKDYSVIKNDVKNLIKHNENKKQSNQQWNKALWLLMIGTIISSIVGLMVNIFKG